MSQTLASAGADPVPYALRPAQRADLPALVELIRGLAAFEKLTHLVRVTPERLEPHLFGPTPIVEAVVAEAGDEVVAFALYFTSFSTFLAQPGIYLEDLYVMPDHRRRGIGRALLHRLAGLALERGCGRLEWSVLDWNEDAIRFYRGLGANVMPDWRICRLAGDALRAAGR